MAVVSPPANGGAARAAGQSLHAALLLLLIATTLSAQSPARATPPLAPFDVAVEDAADVWSRADGTGYANDIVRAALARFAAAAKP